MIWLTEDLNEKDHYVDFIYSLKHSLNVQVKMAQWQYSMGFTIHQQLCRKDPEENQTNKYSRQGTCPSKLTEWVERCGAFDGR